MNIVQAHKYYWPRDGASGYALYLSSLLERQGNRIIPFAMKEEQSLRSPYERFFVSEMKLDNPGSLNIFKKMSYASRILYSREAKQKMEALLESEHIDLVHLHNIYHHISPSILKSIKKRGIPIVMTLHDYHLISPNYTLYHHGEIHEEDGRDWYLSCVKNKCVKDSRAQSLFASFEMIFHHKIMRYYERLVDRFIAPSLFMRDICLRFGFKKDRVIHIPHPIDVNTYTVQSSDEAYVLYAGRLSEEKGLEVLLEAAKKTPSITYKIAGSGPMEAQLKEKVRAESISNVIFLGFLSGKILEDVLKKARIIVLPSLWYENYPLSILEAKALGKIMIASKIGGIPGLLPKELCTEPGKALDLSRLIETWHAKPSSEREAMGKKLRKEVETVNDPLTHVEKMLELYHSLIV